MFFCLNHPLQSVVWLCFVVFYVVAFCFVRKICCNMLQLKKYILYFTFIASETGDFFCHPLFFLETKNTRTCQIGNHVPGRSGSDSKQPIRIVVVWVVDKGFF